MITHIPHHSKLETQCTHMDMQFLLNCHFLELLLKQNLCEQLK